MATDIVLDLAVVSAGMAVFFYALESGWLKLAGKWLFLTTALVTFFEIMVADLSSPELTMLFFLLVVMYAVLLMLDMLMLIPQLFSTVGKRLKR